MTRERVPETDSGIQGEFTVEIYDSMQRRLRDKGWIETRDLLQHGITQGLALELGPGPGYLGLEWVHRTENTRLQGLDISPDMLAVAERNAKEYGLEGRTEYTQGRSEEMPFADETFEAVFTNGSLHEWSEPKRTFTEMWRVLKPGGRIFISDLRRDLFVMVRWFFWLSVQPKEIRPGLISSINAAYTPNELRELMNGTPLAQCSVNGSFFGLKLTGRK